MVSMLTLVRSESCPIVSRSLPLMAAQPYDERIDDAQLALALEDLEAQFRRRL